MNRHTNNLHEKDNEMTPLRKKMIEDMKLAGLAPRTQQVYTKSVEALAKHYGRSPSTLSEEEIRQYLVSLVDDRDVARGTFKTIHFGIKFLFVNTLGRDWDLLLKKRFNYQNRSDFLRFLLMRRFVDFLVT